LTVEPLPTVYRRRADGYRFVRAVLEEAFGAGALEHMCRLTPEGRCEVSLLEELAVMESLFEGACRTSGGEIGMDLSDAGKVVADFVTWRKTLSTDSDLSRDARMMVPVFYDEQQRRTKVWAFLGWQSIPLDVRYDKEPLVLGCEPVKLQRAEVTGRLDVLRRMFRPPEKPASPEVPVIQFETSRYDLATPVMAEVYVNRLLDRDEFRRHCDRHRTAKAILVNLR
jgi:hypothetical protein